LSIVEDLAQGLKQFGTVTVSADTPLVKTAFTFLLTKYILSEGLDVLYFDCDLQFSSLLAQQEKFPAYRDRLKVVEPQEKEIVDSLAHFLSLPQENNGGGLVVIDTLNSLQNMLRQNLSGDAMTANHDSATVLTLFQQFAEKGNKSLLIANLTRSRPPTVSTAMNWEREITGGRMSRMKSDVILSVKQMDQKNLILCYVEYVKPRDAELWEGENFVLEVPALISR
jgi:hypothetical protein